MSVPKQALSRLRKELKVISQDPPPNIHVSCDEANILTWHYVLEGPEDTPYEGGWYWGILKFPREYPFAPPSIKVMTPSGRFVSNTRICLSMSDFHPETWQPGWSLATVLKGLLSFMCEEIPTTGSVQPLPSADERRRLASESLAWNKAQKDFLNAFPEIDESVAAANAKTSSLKVSQDAAAYPADSSKDGADAVPKAPEPILEESSFKVGSSIGLKGLQARSDLNGKLGAVMERTDSMVQNGRIHICVEGTGECVGVKPANLELLKAPGTLCPGESQPQSASKSEAEGEAAHCPSGDELMKKWKETPPEELFEGVPTEYEDAGAS